AYLSCVSCMLTSSFSLPSSLSLTRRPPSSTLFPYTTLFRSLREPSKYPCQCGTVSLAGAFTLRADHVPSRTMRLESSRSVHEPLAASDASISAHHLPRKVPLVPAVAPHTPRSTGRDSCASAQETTRTLKTRTR